MLNFFVSEKDVVLTLHCGVFYTSCATLVISSYVIVVLQTQALTNIYLCFNFYCNGPTLLH
jgi:hypothetical protein